MVFLALVVLVVLILAIAAFFVVALDAVLRGHDLPTSPEAVDAVLQVIATHKPGAHVIYDLGSGRGTFSLRLQAKNPHLRVVGVDKGHVRVLVSRVKARLLKRDVVFLRSDIFRAQLTDADVVYSYLWYSVMPPLARYLKSALRPGTLVITNTSYFPEWQPVATHKTWPQHEDFERLFVYRA